MSCRQCCGIESLFNKNRVAKEVARYRKQGPLKTTRLLIDALRSRNLEGMTLLDIGGGVGAVQHELLDSGVGSAVSVDASTAFFEAAKEEAERRGLRDRVTYHFGNFVDIAPTIESTDIVTLDRVICCYDDMETLVALSSDRAGKIYGLVYPRDSWWVKFMNPFVNFVFWITRVPFRVYIYSTSAVDAAVRRRSFQQVFHRKTFLWQVVIYRRVNGST